jgi:hypothetical protein
MELVIVLLEKSWGSKQLIQFLAIMKEFWNGSDYEKRKELNKNKCYVLTLNLGF